MWAEVKAVGIDQIEYRGESEDCLQPCENLHLMKVRC